MAPVQWADTRSCRRPLQPLPLLLLLMLMLLLLPPLIEGAMDLCEETRSQPSLQECQAPMPGQ